LTHWADGSRAATPGPHGAAAAALLGRRVDVDLLGRILSRGRDELTGVLTRCVELQILLLEPGSRSGTR
jgi:hypothetical protein